MKLCFLSMARDKRCLSKDVSYAHGSIYVRSKPREFVKLRLRTRGYDKWRKEIRGNYNWLSDDLKTRLPVKQVHPKSK